MKKMTLAIIESHFLMRTENGGPTRGVDISHTPAVGLLTKSGEQTGEPLASGYWRPGSEMTLSV